MILFLQYEAFTQYEAFIHYGAFIQYEAFIMKFTTVKKAPDPLMGHGTFLFGNNFALNHICEIKFAESFRCRKHGAKDSHLFSKTILAMAAAQTRNAVQKCISETQFSRTVQRFSLA